MDLQVTPGSIPRHRRALDSAATVPAAGGTVPVKSRARSRPPRKAATTPTRIRMLASAVAVTVVALVVLLVIEVRREHAGLDVMGRQTAPVVTASSDLYFALGDMDAQLANVLLVGRETDLGFTRDEALKIYQDRRKEVSQALQQAAETADADPTAARAVRDILDALGRYETLAAQMILLDEQASHPAGKPPAATLAKYREATDLLKSTLLPASQGLIDRNSWILEGTYQNQRGATLTARTWIVVIGIAMVAALVLLQVYLTRRFHRWVNPALAAATLVAAGLAVSGFVLTTNGAEYLRVAKKDSFDSVLALNRARAVSYDANADESRYLVDPERADAYEKAFLVKTQQLIALDGANLNTFDKRLDAALRGYRRDNSDIEWQGFYGKGVRNITFVGERELAEQTLQTYQTYQVDDRRIRRLATSGQLRAAIAFCTSYNPGDSNYHFGEYDKALSAWIDINEGWFTRSIDAGDRQLSGWTVIPLVAGVLILGLLLLGLRARLAEYH